MISLTENGSAGAVLATSGVDMPMTPQETFVNGVYASVDEAAAFQLERLRTEEGIVPSCRRGCCYCCRYHILVSIAEAHTLAQYVRREMSDAQIEALQRRTLRWHQWDNSRPGRYPSANIGPHADLSHYAHDCPLLVDGACSAYSVRPVVCRVHFVCSDPQSCHAATDPGSKNAAPVVITSVVTATDPVSMGIRDYIEKAGEDFSRSMMLLPHWLAIEMGWDFAISP